MLVALGYTAAEIDLMITQLALPNAASNGLSTVSAAAGNGNAEAVELKDSNRWKVIGNSNVKIH